MCRVHMRCEYEDSSCTAWWTPSQALSINEWIGCMFGWMNEGMNGRPNEQFNWWLSFLHVYRYNWPIGMCLWKEFYGIHSQPLKLLLLLTLSLLLPFSLTYTTYCTLRYNSEKITLLDHHKTVPCAYSRWR